jgi:hypothetical protein
MSGSRGNAKGYEFEASLLPLLREFYPPLDPNDPETFAKRLGKQGHLDKGDFWLPGERRFTLEAKNRAQMELPAWLKQADQSARNFDLNAVGVVVHKRKGTQKPQEQYTTMLLGDFLILTNSLSRPNLAET